MAKTNQPKRPKIGASDRAWANYKKKLEKYVTQKNKISDRKELKDKVLSKIKV